MWASTVHLVQYLGNRELFVRREAAIRYVGHNTFIIHVIHIIHVAARCSTEIGPAPEQFVSSTGCMPKADDNWDVCTRMNAHGTRPNLDAAGMLIECSDMHGSGNYVELCWSFLKISLIYLYSGSKKLLPIYGQNVFFLRYVKPHSMHQLA